MTDLSAATELADLPKAAQDYVAFKDYENAVRCNAALIELKSSRPACARAIRANECQISRSETRAFHSFLPSFHLALMISALVGIAMSGPDWSGHQRDISTLLKQSCCHFQYSGSRIKATDEIGDLSFHRSFVSDTDCFIH